MLSVTDGPAATLQGRDLWNCPGPFQPSTLASHERIGACFACYADWGEGTCLNSWMYTTWKARYLLLMWPRPIRRTFFCLVDAPDADTAHRVHREAHGLVADEIYEVQEGS
jgi:hypothetical protein